MQDKAFFETIIDKLWRLHDEIGGWGGEAKHYTDESPDEALGAMYEQAPMLFVVLEDYERLQTRIIKAIDQLADLKL